MQAVSDVRGNRSDEHPHDRLPIAHHDGTSLVLLSVRPAGNRQDDLGPAGRFRELDPRERGPVFEGWIATVLASYRDYHGAFDEMYYWAPARARETEVDFLLLRDGDSVAIEAKASPRTHDRHLAGLRAVAPLPGLRRRILIYTGSRRMRTSDGIDIWPVAEFLEALETDRLW